MPLQASLPRQLPWSRDSTRLGRGRRSSAGLGICHVWSEATVQCFCASESAAICSINVYVLAVRDPELWITPPPQKKIMLKGALRAQVHSPCCSNMGSCKEAVRVQGPAATLLFSESQVPDQHHLRLHVLININPPPLLPRLFCDQSDHAGDHWEWSDCQVTAALFWPLKNVYKIGLRMGGHGRDWGTKPMEARDHW